VSCVLLEYFSVESARCTIRPIWFVEQIEYFFGKPIMDPFEELDEKSQKFYESRYGKIESNDTNISQSQDNSIHRMIPKETDFADISEFENFLSIIGGIQKHTPKPPPRQHFYEQQIYSTMDPVPVEKKISVPTPIYDQPISNTTHGIHFKNAPREKTGFFVQGNQLTPNHVVSVLQAPPNLVGNQVSLNTSSPSTWLFRQQPMEAYRNPSTTPQPYQDSSPMLLQPQPVEAYITPSTRPQPYKVVSRRLLPQQPIAAYIGPSITHQQTQPFQVMPPSQMPFQPIAYSNQPSTQSYVPYQSPPQTTFSNNLIPFQSVPVHDNRPQNFFPPPNQFSNPLPQPLSFFQDTTQGYNNFLPPYHFQNTPPPSVPGPQPFTISWITQKFMPSSSSSYIANDSRPNDSKQIFAV